MAASGTNRTTVSGGKMLRYRQESFSDSDLSSTDTGTSCDSDTDTSSSNPRGPKGLRDWQSSVSASGELFYVRALPKSNTVDSGVFGAEGKREKGRLVAGAKKEVWIQVDPTRPRNMGRRASMAETLLGLVVAEHGAARVDFEEDEEEKALLPSIVVKGLVPGGASFSCGQIRVGDWLRRIDETDVTVANLERTLMSITRPRKVKLVLHSLYKAPLISTSTPHHADTPKPVDTPILAKLLTGDNTAWEHLAFTVANVPHVVMYLDLAAVSGETDQAAESTKKVDIVYHFPKNNSKLVAVRGIFMTLCQLVDDVTGSPALRTALIIDDYLVHVAYHKEGDNLFVLALPFICAPWGQLPQLTDNLLRVLRFQYGSSSKAFSDSTNHSQLDRVFALFFRRCFIDDWRDADVSKIAQRNLSHLSEVFGAIPAIPVPLETKVTINDILSEFSSADWAEVSEDRYGTRRLYSIIGSCVYFKGFLFANQFLAKDFQDVSLFLRATGVLDLIKYPCLAETVIWNRVFPSQYETATKIQIPRRWFILAVGLNQSLMAVLLESGGCACDAIDNTGPDAFYVDQVRNTLLHLETTDCLQIAQSWFQGSSWPPLAELKADLATQSKKVLSKSNAKVDRTLKELPKSLSTTSLNTVQNTRLRKSASSEFYPQGLLAPVGGDGDSDSTSLTLTTSDDGRRDSWTAYGSDVESRDGSEGALYRVADSSRWLPTLSDLALRSGNAKSRDLPSVMLTAGPVNGLLHYVSLDTEEGIFICPPDQQLESCIFQEVIENFRLCVLAIRRLLNSTNDSMETCDGKTGFVIDKTFGSVREHGVLFQCNLPLSSDHMKGPKTLNYWVVGRIFKNMALKEVYVCYQDLIPQNLVEMAFKLAAGVLV